MDTFQLSPTLTGLSWTIEKPKAIVAIAHGMAEHAARYDEFAQALNHAGFLVQAIDHLGHGAQIKQDQKGHWPHDGFDQCVTNMHTWIQALHTTYKVPVFLLGHSMGSFFAQAYVSRYSESIAGCILSGTNAPNAMAKMGSILANVLFFAADRTKPNGFLNNLSFGSFNKPFAPNRTEFDWLSRDEKRVDAYVSDPWCGYVCTTGFFQSFLKGLSKLSTPSELAAIRKDLPLYLFAGSLDPVGGQGKGVKRMAELYREAGISDVELRLYAEGRHEMLNEINRNDVYADCIHWLTHHLPTA